MNPKGALNEWCDRFEVAKPRYMTRVIGTIQNGDLYGCEVRLHLPGEDQERSMRAVGLRPGKASAEQEAARKMLDSLPADYQPPPIPLDADDVPIENGRILIALSKHLSGNRLTPSRRSLWETHYEGDELLAHIYGKIEPDEQHLERPTKEKARLAMATIWRQFEQQVFQPGALQALQELERLLEQARKETEPTPEERAEQLRKWEEALRGLGEE